MKTTILISTFGLLLGCNQSDRTARHEEKAASERQEAQKELMKGREEANKDLAKGREEANKDLANAREKANKDLDKAHEQDLKANEGDIREPVAGRDDTMMVRDSLKDKLGDDWMVEKSAAGYTATRKNIKKADKDLSKKINDELKSARDDHRNLHASYARGEVVLRGSVDDCDDVGKTADKFAKIDGVNKIVAEMSCNKK